MKAVRLAEEKAEAVLMRLEISRLERKTQEPVQIMTELRDLHRLVKQDAQATAKTRAEVDQTVAVVKKAAADHSVVLEAAHFSSAATNHGLAALVSLGVTFVLAGGLLCWVLHVIAHADAYQPPRADLGWSVAANLSHFGIRLLGVSVVSFLLVVSVRSFRASRHNQITNAHRAGALRTFRELREAASGPVADAILLQATDAIFRPQPTGFGDESVGAPNHVAELMKMFRQETSKSSNAE